MSNRLYGRQCRARRPGLCTRTFVSLGLGVAMALAAVAMSGIAHAEAPPKFKVLYHEAIDVRSRRLVGATERMTFDAYGRRFELALAPNERIRRGTAPGQSRAIPLQGTVEGAPGSWVRITRSASGLRGMFFDGHEMYAIEPAAEIAGDTVQPLAASGTEPVVYRLADVLMPLDTTSCEIVTADGPHTAAAALDHIGTELRIQSATLGGLKQVRVGVVGDHEFSSQFESAAAAADAIIARMNIVDGIFTSQVGVKISLAESTLLPVASDPLTASKAGDLLSQLRDYRRSSPAQMALGLTHLMTGRNLDGDTVGIAYIGTVCDGRNAASLSEGRWTTTQAALIAAHEIGHNFNAPHDGETGACASTPQTFLMAPQLNRSDRFSACSITQMQPIVSNAWCLTAYTPPDAAFEATFGAAEVTVGTAFVVSFYVRAKGDEASTDVRASAALPASLALQSVAADGGMCTNGAGVASCTFGTLAAGDVRRVDLNLTATQAGSLTVNLSVDSSNDSNTSNDTSSITVLASAEAPPATAAASSRGGGGRADPALLMLLGMVLMAQLWRASGAHAKTMSKSFAKIGAGGIPGQQQGHAEHQR